MIIMDCYASLVITVIRDYCAVLLSYTESTEVIPTNVRLQHSLEDMTLPSPHSLLRSSGPVILLSR